MGKSERRDGFEFINSDGSIWLTIPLHELSHAGVDRISNELFAWNKVDSIYIHLITYHKAYRQKGKCGWYQRKISYVKYHIIGHDIKPGEAIRMLYEIIGSIDF